MTKFIPMRLWVAYDLSYGSTMQNEINRATTAKADSILILDRNTTATTGITQGNVDACIQAGLKPFAWSIPNRDYINNRDRNLSDQTERINYISYIDNILRSITGLAGFIYEEPSIWGTEANKLTRFANLNDLFRRTKVVCDALNITFSISDPDPHLEHQSQMGIDLVTINNEPLLDFLLVQSDEFSVDTAITQLNNLKTIITNMPIMMASWGSSGTSIRIGRVKNGMNDSTAGCGTSTTWCSDCCLAKYTNVPWSGYWYWAHGIFQLIDYFNGIGNPIGISQIIENATEHYKAPPEVSSDPLIHFWNRAKTKNYYIPGASVSTIIGTIPLPDDCPKPQFSFNINQV